MAELVRYEITDGVAVLTIDNPPVNALSVAVWDGIDQAVARAGADPDVEAIILIGAGTTFVAGADIRIFDLLKTREDSLARTAGIHALLRRLEDSPKPLVAAIHGIALGGGLEVAMACHYRVATHDAQVGQPEVLLGIIPGAGGTQRLPRLCRRDARARDVHRGQAAARAESARRRHHRPGCRGRSPALGSDRVRESAAKAGEIRRTRELPIKRRGHQQRDSRPAIQRVRASGSRHAAPPRRYAAVDAIKPR